MKTHLLKIAPALALATIGCLRAALPDARGGQPPVASSIAPATSFEVGMLHVEKYGAGRPAIVLIPGLACGPWVWQDAIRELSASHAVYALTLPGFDGRAATGEKPLVAAFRRDFWALLAAEKLDRPVVVGHSLGGTLALALAEEHAERLAGVVAVDGLPVFPALAFAAPAQREAAAAGMAGTYATLDAARELAGQEAYMAAVGTIRPEWVKPAAAREARSDPQAIADWLREDLTADLRPELSRITIPLLEIMPYNSADMKPPAAYTLEQTRAFYQSLLAGAPRVTVEPIEPSRHFVMLDQPEAFRHALAEFLKSLR